MILGLKRKFLKLSLFLTMAMTIVLLQNCTLIGSYKSANSNNKAEGNTGADGMRYQSYGPCANNQIGVSSSIVVSQDRKSAFLVTQNCNDLTAPQPIDVSDLQFALNDSTVVQVNGLVYDQQVNVGGQRVTIEFCQSVAASPTVQGLIWENVGNSTALYGAATQADGSTTGNLNVQPPTTTAPNEFITVPGQTSQFDLNAPAGSLNFSIAGGPQTSRTGMKCSTQASPTYADGSVNAPVGVAQHPTLLNGYFLRAPWKVAGVDYAVGIPSGTVLKDPATINMTGVSLNGFLVVVTGNNITLDGYDFSLNGGWQVNVQGLNATVKNSYFKIGSNGNPPITASSDNLNFTVIYNTIDGSGLSPTPGSMITNANTIEYNWLENAGQDVINYGEPLIVSYNLIDNGGQASGSSDWLQLGTGDYNLTVSFNTFYQQTNPAAITRGIEYDPNNPATLQGTIAYNTGVIESQSGVSYFLRVTPSFVVSPGVTVHDNYVDPTGLTGGFAFPQPSNPLVIYSNDFNMLTGNSL
jgi:hypothetical protein